MESNKWILLGVFEKAYNIRSKSLLNQYNFICFFKNF
uniref:Uncharacterized protein n=1 Tax=viral metagenome TaxID=1070528 RepID=A0A6C0H7S6_9ZZZZ